jgi:hypothetical protein
VPANDSRVTIENEIAQLNVERPHVVLLGAGGSLAAMPNGDRFGNKLPLMWNFLDVLGLRSLIERYGIAFSGDNFEELYSKWVDDPHLQVFVQELESEIRSYFSSLELPNYPTIHDHLLTDCTKFAITPARLHLMPLSSS